MTASDVKRAYRALADRDPVLAHVVADYGDSPRFAWRDSGRTGSSNFAAMVLHIAGQQLSSAAAYAVYGRIAAAAGGGIPSPAAVLALGPDRLRECGLSHAKASYVLALAQSQVDGQFDIENLGGLSDDEVVAALTAVRGIGVWSAQAFLIHNLDRPDVLPAGDHGIRRAVRELWELDQLPTITEVADRGVPWSPFRSYAAALLWASLTPPGEPSDPRA